MAWTAPITFVAGTVLTAAQLNTNLQQNLLAQAPAVGTTVGDYFVSTAANTLARRLPVTARTAASVTTTSATYVALTGGPAVTVTTGTRAMIYWATQLQISVTDQSALCSYAISGATTNAADDQISVAIDGVTSGNFLRLATCNCETILTAGSNVFTLQYRTSSAATGTFQDRFISVMPF